MTPAPSRSPSFDFFPACAPAAPAPASLGSTAEAADFGQLIDPPAGQAAPAPYRGAERPRQGGCSAEDREASKETGSATGRRLLRLSCQALEAVTWAEGVPTPDEGEEVLPGLPGSGKEASRDEAEAMLAAWAAQPLAPVPEPVREEEAARPEGEVDADESGQDGTGDDVDPRVVSPAGGRPQAGAEGASVVETGADHVGSGLAAKPVPVRPASAEGDFAAAYPDVEPGPTEAAEGLAAPEATMGERGEPGEALQAHSPMLAAWGQAPEQALNRARREAGSDAEAEGESRDPERRQEKTAAGRLARPSGGFGDHQDLIKDIQSVKEESLNDSKEPAGITAAKPSDAMPSQSSTPPAPAHWSGVVHGAAQTGRADGVERSQGSILQPEAAAARLVAAVVDVMESQVDARLAQAPSVNLRVNVGTEDVAIRVQVREGAVQTEFRTESSELRHAIQREWAAVRSEPAAGRLQFLEPEFSGQGFASGQGSSGGGERQGRPGQAPAAPEAIPFARTLQQASADSTERAWAPRAASSTVHHASRHLSAVA